MKDLAIRPPLATMILEPGLPPFFQSGGDRKNWETALNLPHVARLACGLPDWGQINYLLSDQLEDNDVYVFIETQGRWPEGYAFLCCHWLTHMEAEYASAVLQALFKYYPQIRANNDYFSEDARQRLLPEVKTADALMPLIRLRSLTIFDIEFSTTPYIGAEFSCSWDEEHGLGILSYGTEIIAIGDGAVACDNGPAKAHRLKILEKAKQGP